MFEKNVSQECRLKIMDELRNYLIKEISQNQILNEKYKELYRVLKFIEHLLISTSTVSACMSISAFAFLVGTLLKN